MRHTTRGQTLAVLRGRSTILSRTSSFAFWAVAALILIGLASYASLSLSSAPQTSAVTTVPTKLNFQGRLTDAAGSVKPSGTYNMKFRLFTVASGGSSVWSEDRLVSASQGVTVTNGQFSVQLGSVTSLPASLFASGALYLEIELPTPATATTSSPSWTEGAMTPRNQMATSAYAYNAETLDGQDGAWYQDAANLTGTVSSARLSGAYTGITQVGTLTSLGMSGNLQVGVNMNRTAIAQNLQVNAGSLGTSAGSELKIATFGGDNSINQDGLTVSMYRASAGTDWITTNVILARNVDNTTRAGAYVTLGGNTTRYVGVNTVTPSYTLDVQGGDINTSGALRSTVVTGTAPLVVASTTKVTSLNADLLDGLDSTAFGDATAANQTTILNRIGTNADAAGTSTVFARLASIDTSKLGATGDAANATGSIFARLAYLISSIGATNDAASSTGSVNAKLAYVIANLGSGGVSSDDIQIFSTSGTWTKPAGAKYIDVYVIGGGGGGSGGYYRYDNLSSTPVPGGEGGAGGGYCKMTQIRASSLPASVTLTVGAGGAGGAAATSTQTASPGTVGGGAGLAGSSSSFSTLVSAPGGAGAGGAGGVGCTGTGGNGAAYNTGAAGNTGGAGTNGAPGGGGSGGGTFGSDTGTNGYPGGNGGYGESGGMATAQTSTQGAVGLSGKHYGLSGATGANGGNAANAGNLMGGGAGGGGGSCGAGGGGGGAFGRRLAGVQYASGAGGNGASGCVVVVTHF